MAQTIAQYDTPVTMRGAIFRARACGRQREDGLWEAWLEFENTETTTVVRTPRETTQPNLTDLTYWARGLTAVYLDGALARTLSTPAPREPIQVVPPAYNRPARTRRVKNSTTESILNPFSVYEKSPELLAKELTALRAWHLRQIIRDYNLALSDDTVLEAMTAPELGSLIMQRVRATRATGG